MTDSSTRPGAAAGGDDEPAPAERRVMAAGSRRGRHVLAGYRIRTILSDIVAVIAGGAIALLVRLGEHSVTGGLGVDLPLLAALLLALWLIALTVCGTYLERVLAIGPDEYRRVLVAGVWVFVLTVTLTYLVQVEVSRAYLFVALIVSLMLCLLGRWLGRRWLGRRREAGQLLVQSLVIGDADRADAIAAMMDSDRFAGYASVARLEPPTNELDTDRLLADVDAVTAAHDIGAVVIAAGDGVDDRLVRRIGQHLEGTDVDLLMTPDLASIASPRRTFTPTGALSLMRCDQAALTPIQNAAKRSLDVVGASLGLIFLGLPMLVMAATIRLTSGGPALFRQERVGRDGETFRILKYRTMVVGSDDLRGDLRVAAGHDEPAFKVVDDPRVTPLGRFLRRWSLDELPQLVNVLRGDMTLVGPRPHPLDDVTRYRNADHRRLLVRPGMTGLWQVAGRSSLPWDDGVKLDLYYIETWSLAGDLVLLAKTVKAVVTGHGAS